MMQKHSRIWTFLDAVVAACLGEDKEGMKRLEGFVEKNATDAGSLYDAACAYAIAAKALRKTDVTKSKTHADRAVALLKQAVSSGYTDYAHMQTDSDLDPIREHPGFVALMTTAHLDHRYCSVYQAGPQYESLRTSELAPAANLQRCRELIARGYRPVAISAIQIAGKDPLVTGSVWQRPIVADDAKETLAQRQTNDAVALLRMDQAARVWPLLRHSPDPRVRSRIIHRLSPMGASPEALVTQLDQEQEVSIRRALILCLGTFPSVSFADVANSLTKKLLGLYENDPDPGIHGAAGWVLRHGGRYAFGSKAIDEIGCRL